MDMDRAQSPSRRRKHLAVLLSLSALVLLGLLALLLLFRPPREESRAWLVGTLQDEMGQPLEGEVVIRRSDGSIVAQLRTDKNGVYRIPLPPGIYDVETFSKGQRIGLKQGVPVRKGMPTVLQERADRLAGLGRPPVPRDRPPEVNGGPPLDSRPEPGPPSPARSESPDEPVYGPPPPSLPPSPIQPDPSLPPPGPPPPPPPAPPAPPAPVPGPEETPAPTPATATPEYLNHPDYAPVQVFYGTDRKPVDKKPRRLRHLKHYYGGQRGDSLSYGWCWVTIPRSPKRHRGGMLEGPPRYSALEYDPKRHIVLREIHEKSKADFLSALREDLGKSPGRQAFVFIHGYNIGFEEAARRTAQMHWDMKFPGTPIFYSWPSRDRLLRYWADEASVEWTVDNLRQFLDLVARQSGAQTVHLIAHSMGNRAMAQAVRELALSCDKQLPLFQEIVLAAPDIDVDVFTQLAQQIRGTARRVTIYASSKDRAIRLSRWFHGYPRVGESGSRVAKIDQLEEIDAVDASNLDTSLVGHSYYGSSILDDLSQLLCLGKPPGERIRMTRCEGARRWLLIKDPKSLRSVKCKCPPPTFGDAVYCPSGDGSQSVSK